MSNLDHINDLYHALKEAELTVKDAEVALKHAQQHYARISSDLGDTLAFLGLSEVAMADGRKVQVKTQFYGSAAQERMGAIRAYLAKQGSEYMIKPKKINITAEDFESLPAELAERVEYEINTNTLKSYLSELNSKGEITDEVRDLFKVHSENTVVLK